jgi:hypothetical protein
VEIWDCHTADCKSESLVLLSESLFSSTGVQGTKTLEHEIFPASWCCVTPDAVTFLMYMFWNITGCCNGGSVIPNNDGKAEVVNTESISSLGQITATLKNLILWLCNNTC